MFDVSVITEFKKLCYAHCICAIEIQNTDLHEIALECPWGTVEPFRGSAACQSTQKSTENAIIPCGRQFDRLRRPFKIDILHLHCSGQRLVQDAHPKQCKCRMSDGQELNLSNPSLLHLIPHDESLLEH